MVAENAATPAAARPRNAKNPTVPHEDLPNHSRPPLIPSETDNAAVSRRPRTKEVTSRYLSCYASPCSSSTSTSSASTGTTATTVTSSSSSTPSRRFPSPFLTPRPSTPTSALLHPTAPRRSQSVGRTRPATPRPDHSRSNNAAGAEISSANRALCTTRSLSVSFQGESFFFQTSKAKTDAPNSTRKPTPERRRTATTPVRSSRISAGGASGGDCETENSRSGDCHLWPTARTKKSNPLTRSLDYSLDNKESIVATVRLVQHSMILDEGRQASVDSCDLSASSDTDSVSSGSNSGARETGVPAHPRATPRGISVPARFWQETNSRLRRLTEPGLPLSTPLPRVAATPKLVPVKKPLVDNVDSPLSSITSASSPLRGPIRPSSPIKVVPSPSRTIASPSRMRSNSKLGGSVTIGQPGNAPSIISFAVEVRRSKKGENKIEEAHLLRLLHNRHLQWRYVNARATSSLLVQRENAELSQRCVVLSQSKR